MIRIEELLHTYRQQPAQGPAEVLDFNGVDGFDVYNITAPFELDGQKVLAGRVEARDSENAYIRLFTESENNSWNVISEGINLNLQDPFFSKINEQIILGGVEVFFEDHGQAKWRTVFYELSSVNEAHKIFAGPLGMKDLRLKQLANKKILVLTRPQGDKGGRGKIGYTIVDTLEDLSVDTIEAAPLISNQFIEEEWGGGNEIHLIEDEIYVLGHIANFDDAGDRHYYAMAFKLDLENQKMVEPKIIAERKDFQPGPSKRPDLEDVVFSGGLVLDQQQALLYAGISDAGAQKLLIKNPFK